MNNFLLFYFVHSFIFVFEFLSLKKKNVSIIWKKNSKKKNQTHSKENGNLKEYFAVKEMGIKLYSTRELEMQWHTSQTSHKLSYRENVQKERKNNVNYIGRDDRRRRGIRQGVSNLCIDSLSLVTLVTFFPLLFFPKSILFLFNKLKYNFRKQKHFTPFFQKLEMSLCDVNK